MFQQRQKTQRIGFLLTDGFSLLSFAAAIEPLRAANLLALARLYEWTLITTDGEPVMASNGMSFSPALAVGDDVDFAAVIACAAGNPTIFRHRKTFDWLRELDRLGLRIGGVSGASFILASAGLLHQRRCTIHWEHVPAFREAFPDIDLRQTLFEIDGNRLTCAGGVAALDMMHALIALDHGPILAAAVSDWFLQTDIRGAGGAQRPSTGERNGTNDPRLAAAIDLIARRLDDPPTTIEMAVAAGVSVRHIERLFQTELQISPARFQLVQRLQRARTLLVQSQLPVVQIAIMTGFTSASHFSRCYRAQFGQTPGATRRGG